MRDIVTNDAVGAQDRKVQDRKAPPGLIPAFKRLMVHTVLELRVRIGQAAQALADACSGRDGQTPTDRPRVATSDRFSDLSAYKFILKHRELGRLFGIDDPFYRCHGVRVGAETEIEGRRYVNFASYDYLGLNQHPAVIAAAKAAIDTYGTSVSASRIVAGERPPHRELEKALADIHGMESAVAFVSGHATNVSTIGTLMTPDDLVVHDELSHNSVLVGAKLSRATTLPFRHNDLSALERILEQHRPHHPRALIAVEGLYSMDGDVADLPRLLEIKDKYGAWLMVDEAHSLGVLGRTGRGIAEHFGVDPARVDICMGTLSKTLATCGGYIAGKQELIDILKYQAPGLVYSVGMSPPLAAAATAALEALKTEPERVARVQANGQLFLSLAQSAGLDTATSGGHAIVSIIIGDAISAAKLAQRMIDRGINALPIIYPAVPLKMARLRFFITSEHTPEQIRAAVEALREELDALSFKDRKAA